jgi:hypothetical protein
VRHIVLELPLIYESIFVNEPSIDLSLIPDPPSLIDTLNNYNRIAIFVILFDFFDENSPAMLNSSVIFYFTLVTSIDDLEKICFALPLISIHVHELNLMLIVFKFKRILLSILFNEFVIGAHIKIQRREFNFIVIASFTWRFSS